MKLSIRSMFFLAVMASMFSLGCGKKSGDDIARAEVSGTVTLDGNPIPEGMISFLPEKGPAAQAPITDGKYSIKDKGGVPVGTCKISIEAMKETGKTLPGGATGQPEKEKVQYIPPKYNSKTTLTATITPGKPNTHDVALESK